MQTQKVKVDFFLAGLLFLLGLALVTQLKLTSSLERKLASQSLSDLVEIVAKLDTENNYLQQQLAKSQQELDFYAKSSLNNSALAEKISKQAASLKALLGQAPVSGAGVKVVLQDKEGLLTDFDLYQLIYEIKAAEGWALAVNGYRLHLGSAFWRQKGKVYLDGKALKKPYIIEAVGNSSLIFQSLTLPRGVLDRLSTIRGVKIKVKKTKVHLKKASKQVFGT